MSYFTLKEFTRSSTAEARGISNNPTPQHQQNIQMLISNVLDPLREKFGKPIIISSGYRSQALNKAVGGSSTSQHCKGQAADIVAQNPADNALLFNIISSTLPFDQLIWEKGNDAYPAWVHVSFASSGNRKEKLKTKDGKTYIRI